MCWLVTKITKTWSKSLLFSHALGLTTFGLGIALKTIVCINHKIYIIFKCGKSLNRLRFGTVFQARQRASVKWLLSKAFNNRVPDNLKEPFYRDHENQERLKPQIIVELGNGTLYCQTLSNLYSDPNYQSLNHWSIIQTLARKGVPVTESSDMPITETVLIQTNPLRIVSKTMNYIFKRFFIIIKNVWFSERPHVCDRIADGSVCKGNIVRWPCHLCHTQVSNK